MSDWSLAPAGPSLEWEHIDTQVLSAAAAAITFSGIDTTYRRFRVLCAQLKDASGAASAVTTRLNNDSGSNYAYQRLSGDGATAAAARTSGTTAWSTDVTTDDNDSGLLVWEITKPAAGMTGSAVGRLAFYLTGVGILLALLAGEWNNTADLISRIDLMMGSGQFNTGTRVTLGGARDSL